MSSSELNLVNHFLIAMPNIDDPMFGGAVIYMCEHTERGALGLVINKPTEIDVATLFERINIKFSASLHSSPEANKQVMFGGPVHDDRGFVLHAPNGKYSSSINISQDIAFTTSRDVLEALAEGKGPERILVSIGYAGWSAGQLEQEMLNNGWLTVPADPAILFDLPIEHRHEAAIKLLGFDPMMLSGEVGHA